MQATRVIVETDERGQIIDPPPLAPSVRMEAIFLVLEDLPVTSERRPPPDIAGQGQILGDIVAPGSDPEDWDALR